MIPNYFLIGVLTYLFAKEFREWIELIVSYNDDACESKQCFEDDSAEQQPEPIPENVKHMYS